MCLHIAMCFERYDGKGGKDQPDDELKHSIHDQICQPDVS